MSNYETYLNDLDCGEIIVLEGHHSLHWTNSAEMANSVNDFVKKYLNKIN